MKVDLRPKIKRYINGRVVEVNSKDATKPISMSQKERLKAYMAERGIVQTHKESQQ